MKYKFRWFSLVVVIGIYLPSLLQPAFLNEGTSSNALYYNIFVPIFLVWLIWAFWKIFIIIKGKIFPTEEEKNQAASYNKFNQKVYGDELTAGKIVIGMLRFVWSTIKFILKIPIAPIVLILKIISFFASETEKASSTNNSSVFKSSSASKAVKIKPYSDHYDNQRAWEYDGQILKPYGDYDNQRAWEYDGQILKPYGDYDNQRALEFDGRILKPYGDYDNQRAWEFNGRILKPYGDYDNQRTWEFDGRILKPYGDYDNQKAWVIDSAAPAPVMAKAAGII